MTDTDAQGGATPALAPHCTFPEAGALERRLRGRARVAPFLAFLPTLAVLVALGWFVHLYAALALLAVVVALGGIGLLGTFATVRRMLGATELHPVTERTQPQIHAIASEVAKRFEVELPPLFIKEDPSVNAFATLAGPGKPVMVINTGFLAVSDALALRGVLAHELSHVVNKDMLVKALLRGVSMLATTLGRMLSPKPKSWEKPKPNALRSVLSWTLLVPYTVLELSVSRSRESLADLTAATRLGGADPVLACLETLSREGRKARRGHAERIDDASRRTHPLVRKRIEALLDHCGQQVSRL